MQIKISRELIIETEIPFLTLQEFMMSWEINNHAEVYIKGIIKNENNINLENLIYAQEKITFLFSNDGSVDDFEVLFSGLIESMDLIFSDKVTYITAKIKSASTMLDQNTVCCAFQDMNQTFSEVVKEMIGIVGGEVISTTGSAQLEMPVICYKETIWEFEKRMASFQNSFIIPDIITGRPSLWFGMRRGKKVSEDLLRLNIKINKSYINGEKGVAYRHYKIETENSYLLGDWLNVFGRKCVIYKKECLMKHYQLQFTYYLAEENALSMEPYYNTKLIGLSLTGTVEEIENENIKISLDIDRKHGSYFYSWMPEAGNVMYAMPEKLVKVALYFMGYRDGTGICVRCPDGIKDGIEKTQNKIFKNSNNVIKLGIGEVEISKSENNIHIADDLNVGICGGYVDIRANGKIKLTAKNIRLTATSEIKAVTST